MINVIYYSRSYLGSLYADKGEKAKATTCYKQAAKLDGRVSEYVKQWHFIGNNVFGHFNVLCLENDILKTCYGAFGLSEVQTCLIPQFHWNVLWMLLHFVLNSCAQGMGNLQVVKHKNSRISQGLFVRICPYYLGFEG